MKRILASLAVLAALGACDQKAAQDSFNKSFAKSANDSCVKSATAAGAPATAVQGYCTCVVDEVTTWPLNEKMNFNPGSEKLKAVMTRCVESARAKAG